MAEEKGIGEGETKDNSTAVAAAITSDGKGKKKHKGILSRVRNGIFRLHGDDFENRLKYISKEEASIIARMKRRSYTWRRMTRNLIAFSVIFERYDTDPAAKAAAATVLASKLGADSGLNVYVGGESKLNAPTGKSNDVELVQSGGLRNRKQVQTRSSSVGSSPLHHSDEEIPHSEGTEVDPQISEHNQLVVTHHFPQGSATNDGGWIARIAALLVGEDPTQSYALICGNCHMHNGLARKEEFPFITYYCPHCHALNRPKQSEELVSGSSTPYMGSLRKGGSDDAIDNASGSVSESGLTSNSPVAVGAGSEIEEVTKRETSEHLDTT